MNFKKSLSFVGILGAVTILTACQPSDSDINAALQREVDQSNQQMVEMVGAKTSQEFKIKLVSTRKIGCKEATGQSGYVCDVETEIDNPFLGKQKKVVSSRFVKASEGWTVVDGNK
ncbi:MAG: hypothetical protein RL651_803 [Pseudomonadota bacterium]